MELLTHLVEVAVEPRHLVVHQVPGEALEVKEQQADQNLSQQAGQRGRLLGEMDGPQAPVQDGEREDEDQVVVEHQKQAAPHRGPADRTLRLQLVPADQGQPGGQQVQQQKGQAEAQVHGEAEEDREER